MEEIKTKRKTSKSSKKRTKRKRHVKYPIISAPRILNWMRDSLFCVKIWRGKSF